MDLVNSVTQNSNNTNVTMENRPIGGGGGDDDGDNNNNNGNWRNNTSYSPSSNHGGRESTMQMDSPTTQSDTAGNRSLSEPAVALPLTAAAAAAAAAPPTRSQVPDYLKAIGMDPKKFWPKKYRFTREKSPGVHNPLTIAQRNFYENNGYIIIDDCNSQKLIDSIRAQYDDSSLVGEFLVDKLVAKNGKLLQYVKCFCDERLMLMTHKLVESFQTNESARAIMDNKQPQRQQLFRDWIYLPFRPIDKVVCAITAIEPVDHVILVVPGTHKVGQCTISSTLDSISAAYETSQERSSRNISKELFECSPENLSSLVEKSRKGFKYINLKAGQTLFYHPGLIHGFSDDLVNYKKRQLATIAYYAAADCEYVDMRKTPGLPPGVLPISLAHFQDKDPSDYTSWINRPKLLQNPRASL